MTWAGRAPTSCTATAASTSSERRGAEARLYRVRVTRRDAAGQPVTLQLLSSGIVRRLAGGASVGADARHRQPRVSGPLDQASEQEPRSEEHTSELQSHSDLVCRLLLEK